MNKHEKRANKRAEIESQRIERIYYAECQSVQVSVLDIPKIFRVGRDFIALHNPTDEQLATRIRDFVNTIRKN